MPGRTGIGIDVGTTGIKIVKVLVSQKQTELVQLFYFALPGSYEENFSDESARKFKSFLQAKKVVIRDALVGISGQYVNIRFLKLPFVSDTRLPHTMEVEMSQMNEKAGTSLCYNYMPMLLPEKKKQERIIALAAVYDSYLNQLTDFFQKANVHVHSFVPNTIGLHHAFVQFGEIAKNEIVYLIDIGHSNISMAITAEAEPYFYRNIGISGTQSSDNEGNESKEEETGRESSNIPPDEDEDEDAHETIRMDIREAAKIKEEIEETKRLERPTVSTVTIPKRPNQKVPEVIEASVKFARVQTGLSNLKIGRILLTGGGARQTGLTEILQASLKCPVDMVNLSNLAVDNLDSETLSVFREQCHEFTNAIGLAHLRLEKEIPLKITSSRQKMRAFILDKHVFECGALLIVFLVTLFSVFANFIASSETDSLKERLERKNAELEIKVSKLQELRKTNQALKEKLSLLQSKMVLSKHFLQTLSWIYQKISPQIYLTKIELNSVDTNLFTLDASKYQHEIDQRTISASLQEEFKKNKYPLSSQAIAMPNGTNQWLILDGGRENVPKYVVIKEDNDLTIYASVMNIRIHGVIEESVQDVYVTLKEFRQVMESHPILHLMKEDIKTQTVKEEEGKLEFILYFSAIL